MAERYQFGRNKPDGQPDEEYNSYFSVTVGDEDQILNVFYGVVLRDWVGIMLPELGPDDIHDELTELLKINHKRITELKVGEQVDFKIGDVKYWIKVVEVQD